ncbi:MAG: CheR family methyltransferase [Eubacteriales bacterium]
MSDAFNKIAVTMKQKYNKDISVYDDSYLLKSIEKRKITVGVKNTAEYCRMLEENNLEADALYLSLNITYSQFFRDSLNFALLETLIIPKLINQKPNGSEIRIWSAGCSSGQEAYSIAMLFSDMNARHSYSTVADEKKIRYRIFATDISQPSLILAKDGIYNSDAVQNVKMFQLQKFFTKNEKNYTVIPKLKENITFTYYNLLDPSSVNPSDSIYGDFDIVFCSNLLFYYQPVIQRFILNKLIKSMSSVGYLISGDTERIMIEKATKLQMITPYTSVFKNCL